MRDEFHLPNGIDPVVFRAVMSGERVRATLDRNTAGRLIVLIEPPYRQDAYAVEGEIDGAALPISGAIITAPRALRFACDEELAQRAVERERAQREAERRREHDRLAREAAEAERARQARDFNDSLPLPFRWYPAIKIVLTGLYSRTRGDGRNRRTVPHICLEVDFARGQLKREAGQLLCGGWPGGWNHERRAWDASGERVRCAACIAIAARLKNSGSTEPQT